MGDLKGGPVFVVEFSRLDIAVLGALVLGGDDKLAAFVILGVQLDGDFIKDGRGEVEGWFLSGSTSHVEESHRHEGTEGTHLALVFVAIVAAVGGDVGEGLGVDFAHPVLREPRLADVGKDVGEPSGGLILVVDPRASVVAVVGDEADGGCFFKVTIELFGHGVSAAKEFGKAGEIVGDVEGVDGRG